MKIKCVLIVVVLSIILPLCSANTSQLSHPSDLKSHLERMVMRHSANSPQRGRNQQSGTELRRLFPDNSTPRNLSPVYIPESERTPKTSTTTEKIQITTVRELTKPPASNKSPNQRTTPTENTPKPTQEVIKPVYVPKTTTTPKPTTVAGTKEQNPVIKTSSNQELHQTHDENIHHNLIERQDSPVSSKTEVTSFYPLITSIGASLILGGLAYYIMPGGDETARSDSSYDGFFDDGARIVHLKDLSPSELERLRGAHAYRVTARSGGDSADINTTTNSLLSYALKMYNSVVPSFMQVPIEDYSRKIKVVKKKKPATIAAQTAVLK